MFLPITILYDEFHSTVIFPQFDTQEIVERCPLSLLREEKEAHREATSNTQPTDQALSDTIQYFTMNHVTKPALSNTSRQSCPRSSLREDKEASSSINTQAKYLPVP